MKLSHLCLFYASNCKTPGITGIAKVVKEGYPDYNAWDSLHPSVFSLFFFFFSYFYFVIDEKKEEMLSDYIAITIRNLKKMILLGTW